MHRIPSPDQGHQRQTFRPSHRRCSRRLFGEPESQASPDSTYCSDTDSECGQGFSSHDQGFQSGKHEGVQATVHCLEGLEHLKPPELDYGAKYLQPLSSPAKKTPRGFKTGGLGSSSSRSPRRRSTSKGGRRNEQREQSSFSSRLDQELIWPKRTWGEPTHRVSPRRVEEQRTSRPASAYKSPRTKPTKQPAYQHTSPKSSLANGNSSRALNSSSLQPRLTASGRADDSQDSPCIKAGIDRLPRASSYNAEATEISPASSMSALEDPFAHAGSPTASEFEDVAITPRQATVQAASRETKIAEEPAHPEVVQPSAAVAESVNGEDTSTNSGQMLCPPPSGSQTRGSAVRKKKSRGIFTSCLPSLSKPAVQKENRAKLKQGCSSETNLRISTHRGGQESTGNTFKGFLHIFTGMLPHIRLLPNIKRLGSCKAARQMLDKAARQMLNNE